MSGRQYTVAIKLVDKDGLLSKLDNVVRGKASLGGGRGSSGASGSGGSSGGINSYNDLFKKMTDVNILQLAKLTGIGLGVYELVSLAVKSSGILQADFKLWETSMTLIFRPIADFFGLILRPFVLAFWALTLPFYKVAGPFFRDWGSKIGQFFADNPGAMLSTIAGALAGAWILKQTSWPSFKIDSSPNSGNGGSSPPPFPKCIELCDKTPPKFTKPIGDGVSEGINQSNLIPVLGAISASDLIIQSTLLDMKNDIKSLQESLRNGLMIPASAGSPGRNLEVNIGEKLGISDSTSVGTASQMDWSKVIASGAGAAVAAGAIEAALARAAGALSSAAGKLEGLAQGIPNSTAFGFAHFGPGGEILPSSAKTRTQVAGMVSALV